MKFGFLSLLKNKVLDPEPAGEPENSACAAAPADNQARSAGAGLLGRGGRRAR